MNSHDAGKTRAFADPPLHPSARIEPIRAAAHVAAVVFVADLMGLPIGRLCKSGDGTPADVTPLICDLPPWAGVRIFERLLLAAYVGAEAERLVTLTEEEDDALVAGMLFEAERNRRDVTDGMRDPRTVDELSAEYSKALKAEARALVEKYREPISLLAESLVNSTGLAVWEDRLARRGPVSS
jgi:hypothetical protein